MSSMWKKDHYRRFPPDRTAGRQSRRIYKRGANGFESLVLLPEVIGGIDGRFFRQQESAAGI